MPQNKTQTKLELYTPSLYSVILHNDDKTTMDFVVDIIINIFGKSFDDAVKLMLKVHEEGAAVCGVYEKEIAVTKQQFVLNAAKIAGFPLKCTVEIE